MRSGAAFHERLIPLDSDLATLATAGGKGTNLARLAQSGFLVPPGFIITTRAYEEFVTNHGIAHLIDAQLQTLKRPTAHSSSALESASRRIAGLFQSHVFDELLTAEVLAAYENLGRPAVAVRSSATAEDLPGLSFAGQQETYLNVVGDEQLIAAIVRCWASLWTARAIEYRARNHVTPGGIAVIVQEMVQSEAAGVVFTAHPVTGDRSQIVIEATHGLGESLVSGRAEPDRFTVDAEQSKILTRFLGAKQTAVYCRDGGGTRIDRDPPTSGTASIGDDEVVEIARLGRRVASLFGAPQDVEWALANDALHLLQSRPITSLFPLPGSMPTRPLQVMFSFAAVQGVMDPFTPLGCDMIRQIFASASHIFGYRYNRKSQRTIATAGGRLWVNVTPLLRTAIGRKVLRRALAFIEPTVMRALDTILDDSQIEPAHDGMRFGTLIRLLRFVGPIAGNVVLNTIAPRLRRERLVDRAESILDRVRRLSVRSDDPLRRLTETAASVGRTFDTLIPPTFIRLVAGVATGMASLHLLNMTARRSVGAVEARNAPMEDLVLEATRGTPNNPTTEMDLALWQIAKTWLQLETEPPVGSHLEATRSSRERPDAKRIAELFETGALPSAVQAKLASFLERYGARGLAELDIGRPRWRDDPLQLFEMLEGYLAIRDTQSAPDAVIARSAERAAESIERITCAARESASGLRGTARAARVRFAARRARTFLGFREYPKFFAVRMMDVFRTDLVAIGSELAHAGYLSRAEDLFYLTLTELQDLGEGRLPSAAAKSIVDARRVDYRRELLRRRIPRLLLSDGRALYEGLAAVSPDETAESVDDAVPARLFGSPVSPGTVEGRARVVHDPRRSGLQQGEIMICPGTDPSWTPLFLIAAGLVMETGGMMTHGAVVAREYGIPAVVGVHEATHRFTTGAKIRLDGSSGLIELLDAPE